MNERRAGLVHPSLVKVEATPRPSPSCSPHSPSFLLLPADVFDDYYFKSAAEATTSSPAAPTVPSIVSSSKSDVTFSNGPFRSGDSSAVFVQRGATARDSTISNASPSPAPSPFSPETVEVEDGPPSCHCDHGLEDTPVSSELPHELPRSSIETSHCYNGILHAQQAQLSDSTHSLPCDFLSTSSSPLTSSSAASSFSSSHTVSSSSHTQAHSCPLPASFLLDYHHQQHHHEHQQLHDSRKHKTLHTTHSEPYQRHRQRVRHGAAPRSSSSPSLSSTLPSPPSSSSSPAPPPPESPLTPPPTPPTEVGGVQGAGHSSPCQRTFREAVSKGNTAELRRILEDREDKVNVNLMDTEGQTALHHSCLQGNLELVKILVRFGADVKLANRDGWAPLHLAVYNGHSDIMLFLLASQQHPPAGSAGGPNDRGT